MQKRIIAIDDEDSILDAYKTILAPHKQEIFALQNHAAGLEAELFGELADSKLNYDDEYEYELKTATQGEEGFKLIKEAKEMGEPFSIAFIDVRMPPGWDGIKTSQMIRQVDDAIEIVIVTAYSDKDRNEIVEKVGMPEKLLYLKKPFDSEEIKQLALSLTKKWELEKKAKKYTEYLEKVLISIKNIKTHDILSEKDITSSIFNEICMFLDFKKSIIAKNIDGEIIIQESKGFAKDELDLIVKNFPIEYSLKDSIFIMDKNIIIPLKDKHENIFVFAEVESFIDDTKLQILNLLTEASVELISLSKKQKICLRNEKMATVGQMATAILHEVNNPIQTISGTIDISKLYADSLFKNYNKIITSLKESVNKETSPEIYDIISTIETQFKVKEIYDKIRNTYKVLNTAVERVRRLMEKVRNFSKKKEKLDLRLNSIKDALDKTFELVNSTLKNNVVVHKDIDDDLFALCDIDSLNQVFLNIILNAVQAMKNKGELWISAKKKLKNIIISIKDSGPGIPESHKNFIFDAFYSTKPEGTGLGLSIVKRIVEEHKGTIHVDSENNKGTVFYIEIPIK
ncbi:MAG: response regulator [Desulfobacterales bacterium]|nr:response regulator [Desulfobacterales bacterium]